MVQENTGCFVYEFQLVNPNFQTEKIALKRFETARLMKNQIITELLNRDCLLKRSVEYQRISKAYANFKSGKSPTNSELNFATQKEASLAWQNLYKEFNLEGEYCLNEFVSKVHKKFETRVGSNRLPVVLVHQLAKDAWESYEPYRYSKASGEGKRGFPRRRCYFEQLTCITSRSTEKNHGPLKYSTGIPSDEYIIWSNGAQKKSKKVILKFKPLFVKDEYFEHAQRSIENDGIKQIRIEYRIIKGRRNWFAQLILAGLPFKRADLLNPISTDVGVDVGVRDIAVVVPELSIREYIPLNPGVVQSFKNNVLKERKRARAQNRSRRNSNPDCFNEKGFIKGKKITKRSKKYQKLSNERREFNRKLNETKRISINTYANTIIHLGQNIHFENVEYSKWQKRSGKSMIASTPGALETAVKKAALKYDRNFISIDTYVSKLSQLCHACGNYTKNPKTGITSLSKCPHCNREPFQRDLYSAFLASFTDAAGNCDIYRATKAWSGMSKSLATEISQYNVSSADSKEILNSTLLFVENQQKIDVSASEVRTPCLTPMHNHQSKNIEQTSGNTAKQSRSNHILQRKKRHRAQKRQQSWSVVYTRSNHTPKNQ